MSGIVFRDGKFWYYKMTLDNINHRYVMYWDADHNDLWIHDRFSDEWTNSTIAISMLLAIHDYTGYVPPEEGPHPPLSQAAPSGGQPPRPEDQLVHQRTCQTTPSPSGAPPQYTVPAAPAAAPPPPAGPPPRTRCQHPLSDFLGKPWENEQSMGRKLSSWNTRIPSESFCKSWTQRLFILIPMGLHMHNNLCFL